MHPPHGRRGPGAVLATISCLTTWLTIVASNANFGPQGGVRPTDAAAESVQAELPGALGNQLTGIFIRQDCALKSYPTKQDPKGAPANND